MLDENVQSATDGYLVIYSEQEESFGLAVKVNTVFPGSGTFLGWDGSFIDAVAAM